MPRNPLAAHPFWRQTAIVAVVLPLFVVAAVLAFAWPSARTEPRDVPLGVVASGPATEQLAAGLERVAPGGYDLHLYADADAARAAIHDREVYGALDASSGSLTVYEASAASPSVAQALTGTATALARGGKPTVVDVVPISATDPRGSVLAGVLLPLTTGGIVIAATVTLLLAVTPLWRRLLALTVVSAVVALGVLLIAQGFLGALPHHPVATWAAIGLAVLSISSAVSGAVSLVGTAGMGLAALVMIFLGNAFAGTASAPDLLPGAVHVIGQWLPPGAAVNLLRSTAYFDGNGAAEHVGVLVVWLVLGVAGMVAGHRRLRRIESAPAEPEVHLAAVTEHPRHALAAAE